MSLAIGVDIGGTKVAGGVVTDDGMVVATARLPTPSHDVKLTAEAIAGVVAVLQAEHVVSAVGVGAAGWIDSDRSTVLFAPNLAWRDEPLRDRLNDLIALPVFVENDANAAAWAEYRFGAAQGERVLAMVTLGTGIGSGLVFSGQIYRGANGIAPEFGHMCVVPGGRRCGCGNRGCWEQYASGKALAREARDIAAGAPLSATGLLAAADGDIAKIDGPAVTAAALAGDPSAAECFEEVGRWLGVGLASLAAALDPSCFVVGGGVAEAGALLLDPTRRAFESAVPGRGFRPMPDVRLAGLGNSAGLIGAADLARSG
ncbi:MAG: ROK family glucokinase [Actinomycetota bacterium]|nr:ROK family glucokinase [Actinomycetota bacterium]